MRERIIILTLGALLDILIGDPERLWHPVRGIGALITILERLLRKLFRVERVTEKKAEQNLSADAAIPDESLSFRRRERLAGALLVILVVTISSAFTAGLLYAAKRVHPGIYYLLSVTLSAQMLAMRSLVDAAEKVRKALAAGNIPEARHAVSMIVGRDTDRLGNEGIAKAAVETVAENTSDGVIAPLFFLFLLGVPGGVCYKAVNTMDSMVGYKNENYRYFGTAAAKTDDVLNYLPARLSALFMIAAAYLLRYDGRQAYRIWKRDRRKHASPNSAQTESVCAGALGLQLAGDAWYFGVLHKKQTIGDYGKETEASDIKRAEKLLIMTSVLFFLCGTAVLGCVFIL
ncbi:MAG: adenosylcobinamide-phosphate synthase CbiB [Lachnospiraceae bacterium]|nr:adenosylcobinamide-phosphate synthase CbiB [Lachnospiraceae bacterium]